jgi:hypothetical protein
MLKARRNGELPNLKDIKTLHFALNNVWQDWMAMSGHNSKDSKVTISKEISMIEPHFQAENEQ